MRTSEQQLLDLIDKHQPVDRRDLEVEAERAGLTGVDRELERLVAAGAVTVDEAGDVRRAPRRKRRKQSRGLSAEQLLAESRRRAGRVRRHEADALAAWRAEWLGGRTLAPEDEARWIEEHRETPSDYRTVVDGEVVLHEYRRVLEYDNGSGWVQGIETTHGGALETLRALGERLARIYGWQPAQATAFILSDRTPVLTGIRSRTLRSFGAIHREEVQIDAHPHQDPEALAAALREARRREGFGQRRPDERQGALADFMVGRKAGEESRVAWARHCREIGHAGWAYSDRSAFHTAVERARRAYPDAAA